MFRSASGDDYGGFFSLFFARKVEDLLQATGDVESVIWAETTRHTGRGVLLHTL